MEYVDFYEVLGVSRDAAADEIKKKYRQLARKYHPDVSKEPDAEERFKQINEAYDVLKDPEKRSAYDQLGANWKHGQDFNAPPGFDFGDGGSFGDIFETLFSQGGFGNQGFGGFGGQQGGGFARKGGDLQTSVRVDLMQVMRGDEVNLTVNSKNLNVKIPKGVKDGQKIRLAGQGQAGAGGGPNGDLLIEVSINKHPIYSIDRNNLILELAIAPWEAALGTKVNVPMPEGKKIQLTIPAGSQSGKKMRIPKKGMPGNPVGDLHVILKIEAPQAETDEQREHYEKMSELFEFNGRDKLA